MDFRVKDVLVIVSRVVREEPLSDNVCSGR